MTEKQADTMGNANGRTLWSREERLQGRPMLCSDCGLCISSHKPLMAQSCTFVQSHVYEVEMRLHGRTRQTEDEMLFGVYQEMVAARLPEPPPGAQWTGMVTTLAARLLEQGVVEGVITTGSVPGTRFAPRPFLARTPEEVRASAGNKPCISPGLSVLDEAQAKGLKRLAVVGTGCQVQTLRVMQEELGFERLLIIGIPCSDNVAYPDLMRFLQHISSSPDTVVHHEFVQDFRVWMRHEDGRIEKRNFVDIPMDKLGENIFPDACMACFDYPNALADITIGYMGAPIGWQWVMVRTEQGAEIYRLLAPDLECTDLTAGGNRRNGVGRYAGMLAQKPGRPPALIRKLIALLQRTRGPKGLEFARSITEMKLMRNLQHVRNYHARLEARMVPYHVYEALKPYEESYVQAFGRSLAQPAEPTEPQGQQESVGTP